MRRLLSALGLIAALAMPAAAPAALKTGAKAPLFDTRASLGGKDFDFSLAKALKKGPVVLYFFPAAFTKGCTVEAREFAEATDDFAKLGATVVGMAADPIEKLNQFSVQECRNKFAVGVATPAMIKGYDVALEAGLIPNVTGRTNRTSYVIAPNGKVVFVHSEMGVAGHVNGTMEAVKSLKAKR
ncbi:MULTISPECIES: peroxiredoxin [unclassified Sphingomonas]|uniref:peroxiredoxin n=1 Tax=unclassified Sphingomonas TaxID=196159 RepID=UPI0006F42935|nr:MULTISPECIES: peroxiredoxin [unclassified Sphingomonas]KQX24852.1 peroxiredoxin [Sphingomonas sp. Root1294]KQY69840.1 peroxiredoxin [Sphingomonas sp. Root50]KRB93955.1 peroxiredoxin [Sphingomonas sp. Root720]